MEMPVAKPEQLVEEARSHLDQGETIQLWVAGTYEAKLMGADTVRKGILCITDRRLLFYAKKWGGYDFESFPYGNISSFEQGKNRMGHWLRFFASGNRVEVKWIIDVNAFGQFMQALTPRIGRPAPAPTPPAPAAPYPASAPAPTGVDAVAIKLSFLDELFSAGRIAPEHYAAARMELLRPTNQPGR